MKRLLLLTVAAAWLAAGPATASPGRLAAPTFWITAGGGIAWPPAELGYGHNGVKDTDATFGGILGRKLVDGLALEARGHFLSTEDLDNLDIRRGEGNLTWFLLPEAHFVPFLTGGAGVVRLESDVLAKEDRFAWNVGAGALVRISDHFGLRVDGRRVSYELPDMVGEKKYRPHTEIFAGLDFSFGGAPEDTDLDGVPDGDDKCPGTPLGARVDMSGCPLDGDGDGVFDGLDQCAGTPKGATVDANGCPSDTDGDGVLDGIDKCPDTKKGVKVDAKGCGLDSDGDGVFDGLDQCAGTPKGCTVNASGCPTDADGDGVCDGVDQCPDTPKNAVVDAKGCVKMETELLETGRIRLEDVNFDLGKSTIKAESHSALDSVGDILVRWPQLRIEVGGHTDSQGGDLYNQMLSEQRAKAVLDYLRKKFPALKAAQLTSKGYGESAPVVANDTAVHRAKNRRVEFKVLNTEALKREVQETKSTSKK